MKRTIVTIGLVLAFAIVGAVVWFLLKPAAPVPGTSPTGSGLPDIGGRGSGIGPDGNNNNGGTTGATGTSTNVASIRQIIDKPMLAPTLSADEKALYYVLRENGHIMASDLAGANAQSLTNLTILETFDGQWSPKKTKLALWYAESGVAKALLQETATATASRFLPPGVTSASWSPDGANIAYLVRQGATTNLVVTDANHKNAKTIYSTPIPDFTVQWLTKKTLLLTSRPSGFAPSFVMHVTVDSKQAVPVLSGISGIVALPIPDGSGFLFSRSTASGAPDTLAIYSFKDAVITPLNQTTIADKCAFSPDGKKLYCAVPSGSILPPSPDSWYRGDASFTDTIVSIDLLTHQETMLAGSPAVDIDVMSLFVNSDGKHLFFVDKKTSMLWRLDLP